MSILILSCTQQNTESPEVNKSSETEVQALFQVSTIDALLQGVFDGTTTLADLAEKGDFGIGTINSLDGEMIVEDGNFYHVRADGKAYPLTEDEETPFASVVKFMPEDTINVTNLTFDSLKELVDSLMGTPNYFYALRVIGNFEHVHTRSVPAQKKPYPSLVEVTSNQPEFDINDTQGMLTGFYCPEFVSGVNVTGYHLHYLNNEKTQGGHLLGFELKSGKLLLDKIDRFEMQLPSSEDFQRSELGIDRTEELKQVEG